MLSRIQAAWSLPLLATLAACIVIGGALRAGGRPVHFADADDRALVRFGRAVYAERCASCHGRYLQGQPLWQLADRNAGLRAPAEDATGPSWQRSDEALFRATKFGHRGAAVLSALDDHAVLASIAFIKARWPVGLRALQAMRNPHHAGMPLLVAHGDWRFPPQCLTAPRRDAVEGLPPSALGGRSAG